MFQHVSNGAAGFSGTSYFSGGNERLLARLSNFQSASWCTHTEQKGVMVRNGFF